MMPFFKSAVYATISSLALTQVVGCTVLGLGTSIETDTPTQAGWEVPHFDIGDRISLTLYDGRRETGYFQGLQLEPLIRYAFRYQDWYAPQYHQGKFPELTELLTIRLTSGQVLLGKFIGFDYRHVHLASAENQTISIDLFDLTEIRGWQLNAMTGAYFRLLLSSETPPYRTQLVLTDVDGFRPQYFDPASIDRISLEQKQDQRARTGVVVDTSLLLLTMMSLTALFAWLTQEHDSD